MHIFDSIINAATPYVSIDLYLKCLAAALGCGVISALAACVKARPTKSFLISLVLLPLIVATVIMIVNGSVGTGIAVMGAFSLIRFRSVPGKARDIISLFLSMTAGLVCAGGFIAIALVFTVFVSAALVLLAVLPLGNERCMLLNITTPESLNFSGAFDDLFRKYLSSCRLVRARTTNMGSLYKLQYRVQLRDAAKMQAFIDELRCRNGNLEISLSELLDQQDDL